MGGEKHFTAFAIAVSLGVLGPASTAWAQYDYENQGGNVKPCSLDGVNPAYHPEIFGNPAAAREFGFVRSPDGTWHTSCAGGVDQAVRDQAVMGSGEGTSQRAPHRRKTAPHKAAKSDL
jgi:hypothetical protein